MSSTLFVSEKTLSIFDYNSFTDHKKHDFDSYIFAEYSISYFYVFMPCIISFVVKKN